tara:strand:+ start:1754 stop:2149 length:396 start_codon:yes stop_codon:yes gene_type:complete
MQQMGTKASKVAPRGTLVNNWVKPAVGAGNIATTAGSAGKAGGKVAGKTWGQYAREMKRDLTPGDWFFEPFKYAWKNPFKTGVAGYFTYDFLQDFELDFSPTGGVFGTFKHFLIPVGFVLLILIMLMFIRR